MVSPAPSASATPAASRPTLKSSALVLSAKGLTRRGWGLLVCGLILIGFGLAGDVVDLLRVGFLLVGLAVAAVLTVARNRYRVSCQRSLEPPRVEAGLPARVTLRLQNASRLPTAVLLAEDQLPATLGGRPRFTLDRVESGGQRAAAYTVTSPVRGRFVIGPLSVRVSDPFGMCELVRPFASTDDLVVTPQVIALAPLRLGGEWNGGGEARSAAVSSVGEDDIATRPYRNGDDLRRVHWRSTARVGELMVRREEQPWKNRAALLLDSRAGAHRGEGMESSFEAAVSFTASIGVHLARRGWDLRLVSDDGTESVATGGVGEEMLLDRLADVIPSRGAAISPGLARLAGGPREGMVVAVCGALQVDDVAALARARGTGRGLAVLLDAPSWASPDAASPRAARLETTQRQQLKTAVDRLTVAGWRVVTVGAMDDFAAVWTQLGVAEARLGSGRMGRRDVDDPGSAALAGSAAARRGGVQA